MGALTTGEPVWELHFEENGSLPDADRLSVLAAIGESVVVDLFVFSHGWNNSEDGARDLYGAMFPLIRDAAAGTPGLGPVGFVGVYWPSLWFPDPPATAGAPSGSPPVGAGTAALSGAQIAADLRTGFSDARQQTTVDRLGALIDQGLAATADSDDKQRARLEEFGSTLRGLIAQVGAPEDAGELALLETDDPVSDYQAAAVAFGTVPPGSSTQGIGDWVTTAFHGAKDALRVLSYNIMKARAGVVGQQGLGPFLATLHAQSPAVRVHLIGHSFGARLVSFALAGIPEPAASPVRSLLLVQGAFSHWSFARAQDNPFGESGVLHLVADRVAGARAATFSSFDWAVCRWYPAASFLAGQSVESSDVPDRWGGMGSDGFQAVEPTVDLTLAADGPTAAPTAGAFHRVDAQAVIDDVSQSAFSGAHSDIRKPALGKLAVRVAAA